MQVMVMMLDVVVVVKMSSFDVNLSLARSLACSFSVRAPRGAGRSGPRRLHSAHEEPQHGLHLRYVLICAAYQPLFRRFLVFVVVALPALPRTHDGCRLRCD